MAWWLQHWLLFQGTQTQKAAHNHLLFRFKPRPQRKFQDSQYYTETLPRHPPPPTKKALAALLEDVGLIFSTTRWLTILSNSSPQRL